MCARYNAGIRTPTTGRYTLVVSKELRIVSIITCIDSHITANMECSIISVTFCATYGASVPLACICTGPCSNGSTINFDISAIGILAATDTSTPIRAIGKDLATIDRKRSPIDRALGKLFATTNTRCVSATIGTDDSAIYYDSSPAGILTAANSCSVFTTMSLYCATINGE